MHYYNRLLLSSALGQIGKRYANLNYFFTEENMTTLYAIEANITHLAMDAIVNAANSSLLGGSGVDGAIHRAAGAELLHACRLLGGCDIGEAKITPGFQLAAKYIIHTVGPVWQGGKADEAKLLAACYQHSLQLAEEKQLKSIAFPCISTGIFGYPAQAAAKIAIRTCQAMSLHSLEEIVFCCFSRQDLQVYQALLDQFSSAE